MRSQAEAYPLLEFIVQDLPKALAILRQSIGPMKMGLASALKCGDSRRPSHVHLVIMDTILPLPGEVDARREAVLRVRDPTTPQAFNSRERELED